MHESELSYVRRELKRRSPSEWRDISAKIGVHFKTIKRIGRRETEHPSSDTVGKLALLFRKQGAA